ncbi:MAG TPA: class I SAM-dependent methyltransferase [Rhizomicrobium sp.]
MGKKQAMKTCPICGGGSLAVTIERPRLPVLQNRVYATLEAALQSPCAPFKLATCTTCGFTFNSAFNSNLVVYDETYDNDVPSPTFSKYYETLARQFMERFALRSGTVIDIGCGKGAFLRTLCRLVPGIKGIGIDPSCTPISEGNCTLIQDIFRPQYFGPDAKLVLLRHVLEHLADPVQFLEMLRRASPNAPLIVEVPDLDWIFRRGAFWDFCYEHSNYFTAQSLAYAANKAGFSVEHHEYSFGQQYQWAICTPSEGDPAFPDAATAVANARGYAKSEAALLSLTGARIRKAETCVLWGMATKGVIFAGLMNSDRILGGIDVNTKKQERFVPGSGLKVHAPEWLKTLKGSPAVIVMNENYLDEIRATITAMGLRLQAEAV